MTRRVASVVSIAVLLGCDRHEPPTAPPAPLEPSIARLTTDRSAQRLVVTAALSAEADPARVGGYTLRLAYDTTALRFIDEESQGSGIAAVYDAGGEIRVAAASLSGFADGVLLRATFQLRKAAPGGMMLVIDELNGMDLSDRRPSSAARLSARLDR
jgi:hypothetical protein